MSTEALLSNTSQSNQDYYSMSLENGGQRPELSRNRVENGHEYCDDLAYRNGILHALDRNEINAATEKNELLVGSYQNHEKIAIGCQKEIISTSGVGNDDEFDKSSSEFRSSRVGCGGINSRKRISRTMHTDINNDPNNAKARTRLWIASIICCMFMVAELIGGLMANSLAIMTDAAHLLSDLAGFLISIVALWLATRAPTSRLSFGFHRAEILGALISVMLIWLLTGILIYEAIFRMRNPQEVNGKLMFMVASAGLCVNIVLGIVLYQSGHGHSHGLPGSEHGHSHGHEHDRNSSKAHHSAANINVMAAYIHVLGDAVQSIGVMLAAGLIWYSPEWKIADPITTFIFAFLVLFTTTRLIKQSIGVLMEGVPEGIDPAAVEASMAELPGVLEVHDLHIWALSIGKPSLSVHLLSSEDSNNLLTAANKLCSERFNIHHSTIQVETTRMQIECNE